MPTNTLFFLVGIKNKRDFWAHKMLPMKKTAMVLAALLFFSHLLQAQSDSQDFMRSAGKIYVVVAVIVAIFIGIVLFLVYLDRRLTKLENQIKEHD